MEAAPLFQEMAYLSYFSPLLKEIGQNPLLLRKTLSIWSISSFFHCNLHDTSGNRVNNGFAATDIHETITDISIIADLPGLRKDNLSILLADDILSIHGCRAQDQLCDRDIYSDLQRSFGSFTKQIRLPKDLPSENIKARYKDGMLLIQIQKPSNKSSKTQEKEIHITGLS